MYSIAEMDCFDADFRKQLHFNFLVTRKTQKQRQLVKATQASWLCDINLDALPDILALLLTSKQHELKRYVLKDTLDCPVGSHFIVCVAADGAGEYERGAYYSKKAGIIANDLKWAGLDSEWWRMSSK